MAQRRFLDEYSGATDQRRDAMKLPQGLIVPVCSPGLTLLGSMHDQRWNQ